MVLVVFLQDYRGVLTGEQYYLAGTVAEFPEAQARALVEAGRAGIAPEADEAAEASPVAEAEPAPEIEKAEAAAEPPLPTPSLHARKKRG